MEKKKILKKKQKTKSTTHTHEKYVRVSSHNCPDYFYVMDTMCISCISVLCIQCSVEKSKVINNNTKNSPINKMKAFQLVFHMDQL